MANPPRSLTLIYDGDCVLCRRSVHWLNHRRTHLPVATVASGQPAAVAEFGHIPGYADNMVVVADDGRFWVGPPDAYLVAMWSVRGTRWLSYVLAVPGLRSLASRIFQLVAGNRHLIGSWAGPRCAVCATTAAE